VGTVSTFYILNHSHTDIGFTDHQDLVFRQHGEFIDQAVQLCERTAGYPPEAQYRWTCEVTGTTERYLEAASPAQVEAFLAWHRRGRIDVGAMQYNFTPLLSVEQMFRSLFAVRRLRERWGLEVTTAMQSDVNGIAWLFADLLLDMGVEFLSMAINPVRGGVPKPYPMAFWWEAPSGRRLLVWNGFHYLFGRSVLKLGDWRFAAGEISSWAKKMSSVESYPFDFLFFQSTHPMRVDNGPPDIDISDFVRRWNENEEGPRLKLVAHREFAEILRRQQAELPVLRGEWMDWWCDGAASTAFETAVNREAHSLLGSAEVLASWAALQGLQPPYPRERAGEAYELASLYNEHTWGAYASVAAPDDPWTKGQENTKAGYAFRAAAQSHDLLARAAVGFAGALSESGPPGRFNLGDLSPEEAYPLVPERGLLVFNTLPWARRVVVDEPEQRGGAAPVGVLDMFFPPGVPWGGEKPASERLTCEGELPAWGWAYLRRRVEPAAELQAGPGWAENEAYRVEIDPATGGLRSLLDKASGHELAGSYRDWTLGEYVYESVTSEQGRDALFAASFAAKDFGTWRTDVQLAYSGPTRVEVLQVKARPGRAQAGVEVVGPGARSTTCIYTLWQGARRLDIEWYVDKLEVQSPESVFFAFPFALEARRFLGDFNGFPCEADAEQIPGSVKAWYPVQGWVGVDGADHSAVLVPLDAPLVHLGGVQTGKVVERVDQSSPVIMSWAMNNHWFVNFKAAQKGRARFRYCLTTMPGALSPQLATRFASEVRSVPIVLRDRTAPAGERGSVLRVVEGAEVVAGAKPSEDGAGIVVRMVNFDLRARTVSLEALRPPAAAWDLLPDERRLGPLRLDGPRLSVEVAARNTRSVLLEL
jgi:alpha-mannosidase